MSVQLRLYRPFMCSTYADLPGTRASAAVSGSLTIYTTDCPLSLQHNAFNLKRLFVLILWLFRAILHLHVILFERIVLFRGLTQNCLAKRYYWSL